MVAVDLLHDLGEVGGVGDGGEDLELEELDARLVRVGARGRVRVMVEARVEPPRPAPLP